MTLETATFPTDAWSAATMAAELGGEHGYYLVAEAGERLVGYAGLLAPEGSGDGDIQTIAVAVAHRREGIGGALLDALLSAAAERGVERIFLEVRADNADAQRLYRGRGFAEIGVRRGYYQPDGVDAIVMNRVPR